MKTQWMRTGYLRTFAGIDAQADARTFASDRRRTMAKGVKLRVARVGPMAFSVEEWRMEDVGWVSRHPEETTMTTDDRPTAPTPRTRAVLIHLTDEEHASLAEVARHYEVSVARYVRWLHARHAAALRVAPSLLDGSRIEDDGGTPA